MARFVAFLALISLCFFSSACAGKKAPEQAAVKSKNILSVLKALCSDYENKKADAFLSEVAPSFPEREAFSASLKTVFSKYDTIHFNVQYSKMVIMLEDKGPVKTTFTWDAEWLSTGGASVRDGGRVTLVFDPKDRKLISIDGKNPFVPQPTEMPGKQ